MASRIRSGVQVGDITRIERRGVGPIYRAVVSIADIYDLLERNQVQYAPRYQRGMKLTGEDMDERDLDRLFPLTAWDKLQLDLKRAQVMAVKYLKGRLFTDLLIWNARKESERNPEYDETSKTLTVTTDLTVPDTGHRHLAYYMSVRWAKRHEEIPAVVKVDGDSVTARDIRELLKDFRPEEEYVFVDIYNVTPVQEGHLYDEFNADQKAPSTAVALDLNQEKTPSRRFVYQLMAVSPIFSRDEIETRRNTIGNKSRKLTTNATLEAAARELPNLERLEKDPDTYYNLLHFMDAFFREWATHFSAWVPGASAEDRNLLRDTSMALSNLIFHPLFKLAFRLWKEMRDSGRDWEREDTWKDAVTKIAEAGGQTTKEGKSTLAMDRDNPAWEGKVLVQTFTKDGTITWQVSNTRQTRDAAYRYLCELAGIPSATVGRRRSAA